MNPLTALPSKVRKAIYSFYAALGIAFGATQVGFATAGADQPLWLLVAFGIFGYLGTALGLVAAANVSTPTTISDDDLERFERIYTERANRAKRDGRTD